MTATNTSDDLTKSDQPPKEQAVAKTISFEPNGKKWVEKLTEEDHEALRDLGEIGFSPS